jgi:TP901 family phage tail tape measure protein
MALNIGDLVATLTLDDKMSKGLSSAGEKLKEFGHGMLPISAGLGGIAVAGFKMSMDLDKAMANVATLIPNSTARVLELKEAVKETSHASGQGSIEIAQGLYQVISAYGDTAETAKILEVSAKAATAGVSTTRDAINLIALVTKGYGQNTAEAAERVADLSFLTVKLGLTTFPELAASMGAVVPIAKAMGVTQVELFAAMSTLSGVTGNAAEVTTQLKATMSDIMKPTEEMSAALRGLGFSTSDAMIQQLGLVGSIRALVGTTDGTTEAIGKLFNGVRSMPAVFALTSGQAQIFDEKLVAMENSSGMAAEAFKEQTTGIGAASFQWTQFHHEMEGVIRALGDELTPAFQDIMHALSPVLGGLKEAIKSFGDLPQPVKSVTVAVLGLVAVLGPASYAIGLFLKSFSTLLGTIPAVTGVFVSLGNTIPVLTARVWLMNAGFAGTLSAIGAVLAALVQVAAAFAVGFAVGSIVRMGLEWLGLSKYIDMAVSAVRQFFMGSNADLEKGADVTKNWSAAETKAYKEFIAGQKEAVESSKKLAGSQTELGQAIKAIQPITDADILSKIKAGDAAAKLEEASRIMGKTITDPLIAQRILAMADAYENADEKAKKLKEEVEALAAELLKADKEFHDEALKTWDEWGQKADKNIDIVVSKYLRLSALLGPTTGEVEEQFNDLMGAVAQIGKGLQGLDDVQLTAFIKKMEELGDTGKLTQEQWEKLGDAYTVAMERGLMGATVTTSAWKDVKTSFSAAVKELPGVILAAFQGGGDVGQAIGAHLGGSIGESLGKSLAPKLTAALGETVGGALGTLMGPLGSLIGSLAGKLMDKLGSALGIGGDKVIMKVNDMRDAFFEAHGGFEAFSVEMATVSSEDWAKKIFDAKTVEDFNALVGEAMSLLDTQTQAQEQLQAAVEKYGITVEELGPKWAQQEMDKKAIDLVQSWKLLNAAGVDVTTLIAKMGPDLNAFVQESIAAGTAIPEAMRPMIEQMIQAGQLLDENGNAYGSVEDAGITFAQTMSEQFSTLIEKIDKMVNALLGIGDVKIPTVHVPVQYSYSGTNPGIPEPEIPEMATGGVVTRPTLAVVGESGPEAVVPLDQWAQMQGGPRGGDQTIHVPLVVDGRVLADVLIRRNRAGLFQVLATG